MIKSYKFFDQRSEKKCRATSFCRYEERNVSEEILVGNVRGENGSTRSDSTLECLEGG